MSNIFINESSDPKFEKNIFSLSAKDLTIKTAPLFTDGNKKDVSNRNKTKFYLGKKLGQGTFATVRLATHIETQEIVAIKILDKLKLKDNVKKRFVKEIKILKQVRHRNIVHLYNVISTKKEIYLVMEYVKGKELFSYINEKKKLSEFESCNFYQQIISGLEYLEKLKIVHRDIKPENIIIEEDKNIKIIDFGLSNIYPENNILFSSCGSPCYAPPEMILGQKYSGSGVDIWSSGIVLYGMLCGYLPFTDSDDYKLYKRIIEGKISYPLHLSEKAKDLLSKILEKNPEKRITIKKIKEHPWFNITNPKIKKNPIFLPDELITPIDLNIISIMVKEYGYNEAKIKIDLIKNRHNNTTTTYYLLLDAKIKKGEKSIADMRSDDYFNYIENPTNFFSYYKNDINKVIKERVYNNMNEVDSFIHKINTYKNSPRNLSLTKNNKICLKKNNKDKEKLGENYIKTDNNINNNILKNKNEDMTKNKVSIEYHNNLDNKEECIYDNGNNFTVNKPSIDFSNAYKNNAKLYNNKVRNRNKIKLIKNKNSKLTNTTYFQRPKRHKMESLDITNTKNNESKSKNKNKFDPKQRKNANILDEINFIKERIKYIKNNSKKKSNNNSISISKMNGSKNKNKNIMDKNKSNYRRELTKIKKENSNSQDKSHNNNSLTIKVNPIINEKKIISKKILIKKKVQNDDKLNNNILETKTFLNKSQFAYKKSKKIFKESYKKSPIKMKKNQTYQKQEKKNNYTNINKTAIYKDNSNKKPKNLKLFSIKKDSINFSSKKNGKNISPKNIFNQKLFVKLKNPQYNQLSIDKNSEKNNKNFNTESKKINNDKSTYNSNGNCKNIEEQNNYNKLKSIDLKIKNLTRNKKNEIKKEIENSRAKSVKERDRLKETIQKKISKYKMNQYNSKKISISVNNYEKYRINKIKINKKRNANANINTTNSNKKFLNRKKIHLRTESDV